MLHTLTFIYSKRGCMINTYLNKLISKSSRFHKLIYSNVSESNYFNLIGYGFKTLCLTDYYIH